MIEIKNRFDLVKKELEALGQQRKRISIRQMEEFAKLEEIKNKKYVGKNENDKAKRIKMNNCEPVFFIRVSKIKVLFKPSNCKVKTLSVNLT